MPAVSDRNRKHMTHEHKRSATSDSPNQDSGIPQERIAAEAHRLWLERGKPEGKDRELWNEALARLRRERMEQLLTAA